MTQSNLDLRVELLRVHTRAKLVSAIEGFGDKIGATRLRALDQLVTALAEQVYGVNPGRFAWAMPCGGGKTQAAVALIAAAYELDPSLTFAMCANTVKALCLVKRDLMRAGVPEEHIGLRHSKSPAELKKELAGEDISDEAMANTGGEDRPIMLVTHSHIKGPGGAMFSKHDGKPRSLMIWDETLLASDAGFMPLREILSSAIRLGHELNRRPALKSFIDSASLRVGSAQEALSRGEAPDLLDLMEGHDPESVQQEARSLPTGGTKLRSASVKCVQALVKLAERDASVALVAGDDDAIIHYAVRVSAEWRNIAVLDASFSVSLLAQAGDVISRTTDEMRNCRTYEDITVRQIKVAAGKSTQLGGGKGAKEGARHAARIIGSTPSAQRILVITFKDAEETVKRVLKEEGIDLDAEVDGERRVSFLTWGQETSTNAFVGCECVIVVGLFRMNRAQVIASLAGEAKDSRHRRAGTEVDRVALAETARALLQGLHRGSCRVTGEGGRARRMTAHIIDSETGVRDLLVGEMPGVNWPQPKKPANELPRPLQEVVERVRAILSGLLAQQETEVSVRALKAKLGRAIGRTAWQAVVERVTIAPALSGLVSGWVRARKKRSLVWVAGST